MRNLKDFTFIQENSLSNDVCDKLVNFFHSNPDLHIRYDNQTVNFTQLFLTKNRDRVPELHRELELASLQAIKMYKQHVPETLFWPEKYGFESFRIKYYNNNNNDQFKPHVDSINLESMKRFVAFFWYLTDVEDGGGETEFLNIDLKIKPKKGTLFMFPPNWQFPHKGNPTTTKEKFLLSSYLHIIQ
jgi:hypothetical protein